MIPPVLFPQVVLEKIMELMAIGLLHGCANKDAAWYKKNVATIRIILHGAFK